MDGRHRSKTTFRTGVWQQPPAISQTTAAYRSMPAWRVQPISRFCLATSKQHNLQSRDYHTIRHSSWLDVYSTFALHGSCRLWTLSQARLLTPFRCLLQPACRKRTFVRFFYQASLRWVVSVGASVQGEGNFGAQLLADGCCWFTLAEAATDSLIRVCSAKSVLRANLAITLPAKNTGPGQVGDIEWLIVERVCFFGQESTAHLHTHWR